MYSVHVNFISFHFISHFKYSSSCSVPLSFPVAFRKQERSLSSSKQQDLKRNRTEGQRIMCSSACENQGVESSVDDSKSQINETSLLLEFAANDDLVGFRQVVESGTEINVVGHWYGRQNGSNQMVLEQRTPAMIASLYGSLNVLNFILSEYTEHGGDINRRCGSDGSTALHCAAAGGSMQAPSTVRILLDYGADPKVTDFQGHRPGDVIIVSSKLPHVKLSLESMLLVTTVLSGSLPIHVSDKLLEPRIPSKYLEGSCLPNSEFDNGFVLEPDNGFFLPLTISSSQSPSPETSSSYLSSPLFSSSPKLLDIEASKMPERFEKPRDYPVDPSLPDIKNSSYTTDEFRMFSFKIRPCSRAYSHDWTECPFVHPGENARRRDPRRYHYSCVPCPDFRKGACKRGDACEYAHGVFECWLHPAQYRTRLCKDGLNCNRRVCFFAHTTDELRSLYVSTGSVGPSQRALTCLDTMSLGPSFAPSSPSSVLMMSPFSPNSAHNTFSTPPMSPSTTVSSLGVAWQAGHDIPTLQLPVASLQGSRLRASLNARELSVDSINGASEFEGQFVSEFSGIPSPIFSSKALANAANGASGCGNAAFRMGKFRSTGLRGSPSPAKLEELFSAEMLPLSMLHDSSLLSQVGSRIQGQKTDEMQLKLMQSQINSKTFPQMPTQHQVQPQLGVSKPQMLQSPFNFSSSNVPSFSGFDSEQQNHRQSLLEDSPFVLASPSQAAINLNMQSSNMGSVSPASAASLSALLQKDKRSCSSRDLWAGLVPSDWGSPTGKAEWGVQKDDLCRLRKINSCKLQNSEEPVVSWSQKLGIEAQNDTDPSLLCSTEISDDALTDTMDHSVLSSWIEQMPA